MVVRLIMSSQILYLKKETCVPVSRGKGVHVGGEDGIAGKIEELTPLI